MPPARIWGGLPLLGTLDNDDDDDDNYDDDDDDNYRGSFPPARSNDRVDGESKLGSVLCCRDACLSIIKLMMVIMITMIMIVMIVILMIMMIIIMIIMMIIIREVSKKKRLDY